MGLDLGHLCDKNDDWRGLSGGACSFCHPDAVTFYFCRLARYRLRAVFPSPTRCFLRGFFFPHIGLTTLAASSGHAAPDHLAAHIEPSCPAAGDSAAVAAHLHAGAAHQPGIQDSGESRGHGFPTSERSEALPGFRRYDGEQADAFAAQIEKVPPSITRHVCLAAIEKP